MDGADRRILCLLMVYIEVILPYTLAFAADAMILESVDDK